MSLKQLFKALSGPKMTKEQLEFQDELRGKVKRKEITVAEAHRIWDKKYGEKQP